MTAPPVMLPAPPIQNRAGGWPAQDARLCTATFQPAPGGLHSYAGVLPAPAGYVGAVTLLGPEALRVDPARWVVPGTQAGAQGDYVATNPAPAELAIGARDASLQRIDRLVVSVLDTGYTPNEGLDDAVVRLLPGAPVLTGPVAPDLPPNSVHLGYVNVPPGAGTVTLTPSVLARQVAVGGIQPVATGDTSGPGGYDGQVRDHPTLGLQRSNAAGVWGALNVDRLRAPGASHLSLTSTGHPAQFGPDTGVNLALDPNTVQARNAGAVTPLGVNNIPDADGVYGDVLLGAARMVGAETGAQARAFVTPRLRIDLATDMATRAADNTGTPSIYHAFQLGGSDQQHIVMDGNEGAARTALTGVSEANPAGTGGGKVAPFTWHGLMVESPTLDEHPARRDTVNGPVLRVVRTSTGGLANNTWATIGWDAQQYDSHGMWSSGSGVVCRRDGYYWVTAGFAVAASATGRRAIRVLRDGVVMPVGRLIGAVTASVDAGVEASGLLSLAVGSVVTVQAYQDSGSSQSVSTADYAQCTLQMMWQRFPI